MADRRRRRREDVTSESEYSEADTSKASIEPIKNSECESEGEVQGEGSEYESATEENEEDDYTYTEDCSEDESSVLVEEEYTESELFEEERQSGDGEEQPSTNQELDDDEDRKNPAFVPRKGMFYEHDDRQGEEEEGAPETEAPPIDEKEQIRKKKQLWQEVHRWDHDRFDEGLQAPKSREELIAAYGYDIQLHDKPPEAPPARARGGRGRGRPSENRASFGDYMSGRFDNPRKPRYGPKAEPRGRGSYRGARGVGRGGRGSRGGSRESGDVREQMRGQFIEEGQGDRKSYTDFRSNNHPRNNYNEECNNRSNNRYQNNSNQDKGQGDSYRGNRDHMSNQNRDYSNRISPPSSNSESRTFTNSRVSQGSQQQDYGSNRQGSQSDDYRNNRQRRNSGERQDSRNQNFGNRSQRSNNERPEQDSRQYSDFSENNRQYSSQRQQSERGGYRNRGSSYRQEGPPSSGGYNSRNERRDYGNRKSRSPEGKRPVNNSPRAEASLDNLMDIAPPLTTIETRTKATMHTVAADTDGRRGGYGQDRRTKGARRSQDEMKSEGQTKGRENPEKPPRFRDQAGKDQSRVSGYHGPPQASSSPQQPPPPTQSPQQGPPPPSAVPAYSKQHPVRAQANAETAYSESGKTVQVSINAPTANTNQTTNKPDVRQPKRYSSQRQRNTADPDNNPNPQPLIQSVPQQQQQPQTPPNPGMTMVPGMMTQKVVMTTGSGMASAQVGVLPSGQIVAMPGGVGVKPPEGPRVVSPPGVGTNATSPARPRMPTQQQQQYYLQQQQPQQQGAPQQAVFRQPPPVYRSVPQVAPRVTSPKSPPLSAAQQAQLQQHLLQQQQAIAMQAVPSTQIQAGRIFATSQHAARPAATITMATTGPPRQQVIAQRTQFIPAAAAGSLVNLAATTTRPPGQVPVQFSGQVPVQFPGPPPQRAEVRTTTANVANVVQGQIVTLPPVPQGQLPPTAVAIPGGQHPPIAQNPAQVAGPPGPGQPPAIHVRGGTTYFDPQIQLSSDGRSPARRQKEPIPIVKPQLQGVVHIEGEDGRVYEMSEGNYQQQFAAAYAEAQVYYRLQMAEGQQSSSQEEVGKASPSSSSFESILKQSGSLDNIKEFHPRNVASGGLVPVETELIGGDEEEEVEGQMSEEDSDDDGTNVIVSHDDRGFVVPGIDKELQQLHVSGSSVEHERYNEGEEGEDDSHVISHENQSYTTDGNQSCSTDGNQSYSSLMEGEVHKEGDLLELQEEEEAADLSLMQSGMDNQGQYEGQSDLEGREKVIRTYDDDDVREVLDNEQKDTTGESDSEQFYEAENNMDSDEMTADEIGGGVISKMESMQESGQNQIEEDNTVAGEYNASEPVREESELISAEIEDCEREIVSDSGPLENDSKIVVINDVATESEENVVIDTEATQNDEHLSRDNVAMATVEKKEDLSGVSKSELDLVVGDTLNSDEMCEEKEADNFNSESKNKVSVNESETETLVSEGESKLSTNETKTLVSESENVTKQIQEVDSPESIVKENQETNTKFEENQEKEGVDSETPASEV